MGKRPRCSLAGPGVGTITLPGLGLPVGAPAINPVPRRMILRALAEVIDRPLEVVFSVPGGEDMAAKTSNARLGIVGGISILGTTGIVRPFSTAAYRASVVQQVDVAAAQGRDPHGAGHRQPVGAGRPAPAPRGRRCLRRRGRRLHRDLPAPGGAAGHGPGHLRRDGRQDRQAGRRRHDDPLPPVPGRHGLLAAVAAEAGAPPASSRPPPRPQTARHFFEACLAAGCVEPLAELCRRAAAACRRHVAGALAVEVLMVDFEGDEVVARG